MFNRNDLLDVLSALVAHEEGTDSLPINPVLVFHDGHLFITSKLLLPKGALIVDKLGTSESWLDAWRNFAEWREILEDNESIDALMQMLIDAIKEKELEQEEEKEE
jgi:hypothetical protein